MTLTPTPLPPREFRSEGRVFPDPNPSATPDEVRRMLAVTEPKLTNASVEGPALQGGTRVYTFKAVVGTKG